MNDKIYVFPNADFKFKYWSASLPQKIFISSSGGYWNFLALIVGSLRPNRRVVVFYRYLNVRKGIVHEFVKLTIDLLIILLAFLRIIEIRWVIHNLDRESYNRYAFITNLKRAMLNIVSSNFYITSESLERFFPYEKSKLKVISFGQELKTESKIKGTEKIRILIEEWKENLKTIPKYIGIVTNWSDKECDSMRLVDIVLNGESKGNIGLVYLGKKTNIENEYFLEINERIDYFLKDLKIDLVLKSLNDKSIPFTMYSAATAGVPIMTTTNSHFVHDLLHYNLGGSIQQYSDVELLLVNYEKSNGSKYLRSHTWSHGARMLTS